MTRSKIIYNMHSIQLCLALGSFGDTVVQIHHIIIVSSPSWMDLQWYGNSFKLLLSEYFIVKLMDVLNEQRLLAINYTSATCTISLSICMEWKSVSLALDFQIISTCSIHFTVCNNLLYMYLTVYSWGITQCVFWSHARQALERTCDMLSCENKNVGAKTPLMADWHHL